MTFITHIMVFGSADDRSHSPARSKSPGLITRLFTLLKDLTDDTPEKTKPPSDVSIQEFTDSRKYLETKATQESRIWQEPFVKSMNAATPRTYSSKESSAIPQDPQEDSSKVTKDERPLAVKIPESESPKFKEEFPDWVFIPHDVVR